MKIKKKIFLLIILLVIQVAFSTVSIGVEEIVRGGQEFIDASNSDTIISNSNIKNTSDIIYNTLIIIATCVAVIMGSILGIKYIISSVEGRAKISEALIPYVIGCFVVFGSFFIWKAIIIIGNNIFGKV